MNNTTLVTAIYNYSPHSRMGGRGYCMHSYSAPFFNIVNLGLPIVIYTHNLVYPDLIEYLEINHIKNVHVELFELEECSYASQILSMKESNGIIDKIGLNKNLSLVDNDRNHVLCLSKLSFVQMAIDKKTFNTDRYYWIDAGLFHNGLFPESLGGMERATSICPHKFWPINKQTIIHPGLIERLTENTSHNFIFLTTDKYYGKTSWWDSISLEERKGCHVVGGLLGGETTIFVELIKDFYIKLTECLKQNILTLEEEILSILYAEKYNYLGSYEFDTWSHDVKGNSCYGEMPENSRCFYKIFK